ncbi:MAG: radical SAM protein [Desulfobacteraceae bacterium]|nr:radical SAM protein [Desulfobacteraceae bacterium]
MEKLLENISRAGLAPPRILTLMITGGCNLRCRHCWPESDSFETARPVPVDTLGRLIKGFVQLGIEEVCLTGGEPLTHPDWFEILRFSATQAGLKHVRLQTNATLLTEVETGTLSSMDFEGLIIQVSLEGATAQTHDQVRGRGSFVRAFRGLKLLAEAGLARQTEVAFTETQHNFGELPRLFTLLDELGIGRLVSGTLVQAGRAARADGLSLPTPSQYRELLARYHDDAAFKETYNKIGNIAAIEWFKGRTTPSTRNCICIEMPYITAEGKLYPCIMLPLDKFAVLDVHHRPLEEALLEALPLWAQLPELNRRRSLELETCKECPGRLHCAGGCMGRAHAATGDPMTVEDRCALRRAVYSWEAP